MIMLTEETAKTAKQIRSIAEPEWGNWKFDLNGQDLNDGMACDVISNDRGSRILFSGNYRFWEVVA